MVTKNRGHRGHAFVGYVRGEGLGGGTLCLCYRLTNLINPAPAPSEEMEGMEALGG